MDPSDYQPPQDRDQPVAQDDPCRAVMDLIPAYSVGAADPFESAFVHRHLADCPEAVAELRDYQALADALLHSAAPRPAPAGLESELVAGVTQASAGQRRWRLPSRWVAAAAILLLLLSNGYWWREVDRARDGERQVAARLDDQNTLLASLSTGSTQHITLPPADSAGAGDTAASLIWNPQTQTGVLYARQFPLLAPDMAYQIWLIQGEGRISPGLFHVNPDGMSVFVFTTDAPLDTFDAIGITPEPADGSPGPTAPPVVFGELADA